MYNDVTKVRSNSSIDDASTKCITIMLYICVHKKIVILLLLAKQTDEWRQILKKHSRYLKRNECR